MWICALPIIFFSDCCVLILTTSLFYRYPTTYSAVRELSTSTLETSNEMEQNMSNKHLKVSYKIPKSVIFS